jgi:hypothetical protein
MLSVRAGTEMLPGTKFMECYGLTVPTKSHVEI